MSKPGKVLKGLCKKLGVRLTVKRGKKRVYKSIKVLKEQCKRKKKKKKVKRKKVKRKRRRKFGSAMVVDDADSDSDDEWIAKIQDPRQRELARKYENIRKADKERREKVTDEEREETRKRMGWKKMEDRGFFVRIGTGMFTGSLEKGKTFNITDLAYHFNNLYHEFDMRTLAVIRNKFKINTNDPNILQTILISIFCKKLKNGKMDEKSFRNCEQLQQAFKDFNKRTSDYKYIILHEDNQSFCNDVEYVINHLKEKYYSPGRPRQNLELQKKNIQYLKYILFSLYDEFSSRTIDFIIYKFKIKFKNPFYSSIQKKQKLLRVLEFVFGPTKIYNSYKELAMTHEEFAKDKKPIGIHRDGHADFYPIGKAIDEIINHIEKNYIQNIPSSWNNLKSKPKQFLFTAKFLRKEKKDFGKKRKRKKVKRKKRRK